MRAGAGEAPALAFWDASSLPPHPAPPLFSPTLILREGKACIFSPVLLLVNMLKQKGLALLLHETRDH